MLHIVLIVDAVSQNITFGILPACSYGDWASWWRGDCGAMMLRQADVSVAWLVGWESDGQWNLSDGTLKRSRCFPCGWLQYLVVSLV